MHVMNAYIILFLASAKTGDTGTLFDQTKGGYCGAQYFC